MSPRMLVLAACLTVAVGLMHSVLGGRRLIGPITRLDNLPVILGSPNLTRLTLQIGWHALSVTWWAMAAVMLYMHVYPEALSPVFLWMVSGVFALTGLIALIGSNGKHLSWVMFLPVAAILAYVALNAAS